MVLNRTMLKRMFYSCLAVFLVFMAFLGGYYFKSAKERAATGNTASLLQLFDFQLLVFMITSFALAFLAWFLFRLYLEEGRSALIDHLTELYNKRAVAITLNREIERTVRFKHPLSVAVVDIDHFKMYNDRNGHVAGDKLLKRFAGILRRGVREIDFVGRIGGEEFILIFPETSIGKACEICERLRKQVEKKDFLHEEYLPGKDLTFSCGLAEMDRSDKNKSELLIHRADLKLYQAKREGRNRVVC